MLYNKENSEGLNHKKIIDNIRGLAIDMIKEAGSGHPGIALGAAPILYTLYTHHLKIDVNNPNWYNRDRFVMSAGHGSALLYATLFMCGYNITIDDLKNFRKIDSITPGHPEYNKTPGVDMTTGPLGQGIGSAVGMAIGEKYLNNYFTSKKSDIVNNYTYVLCGDGDLMEGISYEATSLAGTLALNKLIVLYDSNNVSLDGFTNKTFTEDITKRFEAINWNVITVSNGEDITLIDKAIDKAKASDKPTLIEIKTTIGKYSNLENSNKIHGAKLNKEDVTYIKEKLDLRDIPFTVSDLAITDVKETIALRNKPIIQEYNKKLEVLPSDLKLEYEMLVNNKLDIIIKNLNYQVSDNKIESTRDTSSKVLNEIAKLSPFIIGGSADLSSSNKTYLNDLGDFSKNNLFGRNIFYGVREHAMGAISNGLALYGLKPFASTFLTFSDYLKPALRMSALMNLGVIYIFTHDSIMIGEDGPTHQPVEQLAGLRATPNLNVYRPFDSNEVIGAYQEIINDYNTPSTIILSKNPVKISELSSQDSIKYGAYVIKRENKRLDGIIISSGEEVQIAIDVANLLLAKDIDIRVVSMPSINKFLKQSVDYQEEILPTTVKVAVIEASSSYSWQRFVYSDKYLINVNEFGLSGSKEDILKRFAFDKENILEKIEKLFK
ncbi:MAG: transketolase [Bacilli bacterium]